MNYREIKLKFKKEYEEKVEIFLSDLGIDNMAIEDPDDLKIFQERQNAWDLYDDDLIKLEKGFIRFTIYLDDIADNDEREAKIRAYIEELGGEFSKEIIDDSDWKNNWKKFFKILKPNKTIVIVPTWEEYEKKDGEEIIKLEPGMAFGTGSHETTSLCIKKLEEYMKPGRKVLDIGTGSGILSIAASKLGASEVLGVDIDPMSVYIANENKKLNEVTNAEFIVGDLLSKVNDKYDIVVSNILAEVIVTMTGDLHKFINKDGIFISSGILKVKSAMVIDSLEANGFDILNVEDLNEWTSIVAKHA